MNTLTIPGVRKKIIVPASQIVRVEAVSNYSRIHFADGNKILTAKVLQWFQDMLPQEMFIRVHRSHLVNRQFVKEISGSINKIAVLHNGETVSISRKNKKQQITYRQQGF